MAPSFTLKASTNNEVTKEMEVIAKIEKHEKVVIDKQEQERIVRHVIKAAFNLPNEFEVVNGKLVEIDNSEPFPFTKERVIRDLTDQDKVALEVLAKLHQYFWG